MLPICSTQPTRCSASYPAFLEGKSSPFLAIIFPATKQGEEGCKFTSESELPVAES